MAFKDFFKKEEDDFDPLKDLELSKLRMGYMVDYDDKTWQVTDYYKYDYDGDLSEEWELTSGRESLYLERTEDDEVEWALAKKIPIGAIEGNVRQHIIENDDPPDKVEHKGTTYYLDASGVGKMHKDSSPTQEFIYWEFIDENDELFLVVEQWGDTEFEAAAGQYAEEYQFTNILPSAQ